MAPKQKKAESLKESDSESVQCLTINPAFRAPVTWTHWFIWFWIWKDWNINQLEHIVWGQTRNIMCPGVWFAVFDGHTTFLIQPSNSSTPESSHSGDAAFPDQCWIWWSWSCRSCAWELGVLSQNILKVNMGYGCSIKCTPSIFFSIVRCFKLTWWFRDVIS